MRSGMENGSISNCGEGEKLTDHWFWLPQNLLVLFGCFAALLSNAFALKVIWSKYECHGMRTVTVFMSSYVVAVFLFSIYTFSGIFIHTFIRNGCEAAMKPQRCLIYLGIPGLFHKVFYTGLVGLSVGRWYAASKVGRQMRSGGMSLGPETGNHRLCRHFIISCSVWSVAVLLQYMEVLMEPKRPEEATTLLCYNSSLVIIFRVIFYCSGTGLTALFLRLATLIGKRVLQAKVNEQATQIPIETRARIQNLLIVSRALFYVAKFSAVFPAVHILIFGVEMLFSKTDVLEYHQYTLVRRGIILLLTLMVFSGHGYVCYSKLAEIPHHLSWITIEKLDNHRIFSLRTANPGNCYGPEPIPESRGTPPPKDTPSLVSEDIKLEDIVPSPRETV